jgi:protein required for attachment to host cells
MVDLKKGALVAVVDGEHLRLFSNTGEAGSLKLTERPAGDVSTENKGSGGRHASSSANPSDSQQDEDAFAAGAAELLNRKVMSGSVDELVVIAAPRTLGELRKHYHATLSAKLVAEVSKDLAGRPVADIEKTVDSA